MPMRKSCFSRWKRSVQAVNAKYAKAGQEIKLHCLSGYRGSVYNDKCGGAGGSMHLAGGALDFFAVLYEKGQQIIHIPNDYQVGLLTKSMAGGFGWGSNNDLHVDIGRTRHWWYKYKSWTSWKANQGEGDLILNMGGPMDMQPEVLVAILSVIGTVIGSGFGVWSSNRPGKLPVKAIGREDGQTQ